MSTSKGKKKNIILFVTDQHRVDTIGVYGSKICQTPNIDKIARRGMLFKEAYTCTAICSPARASILTGRYPHKHRIINNIGDSPLSAHELPEDEVLFNTLLLEIGYQCGYIGKWHLGEEKGPTAYGFEGIDFLGYGNPWRHKNYREYISSRGLCGVPDIEDIFTSFLPGEFFQGTFPDGKTKFNIYGKQPAEVESSVSYYLAERTIELLRKFSMAWKEKKVPFFIRCDFWGPHFPYFIPEPYFSMYKAEDVLLTNSLKDSFNNKPYIQELYAKYWGLRDISEDKWKDIIARYWGYVTLIDDQIGRILNLLEDLEILEDTMIVFTSDHGSMIGTHGLIDKGPFMYDDIYRIPLIVSCPGLVQPNSICEEFVSLLDLMPTFLELGGARVPENIDGKSLIPILEGETPSNWRKEIYATFHGHQVFYVQRMIRTKEYKYVFNGTDIDELYDLKKDPYELYNLIDRPEIRHVQAELQACLARCMKEANDPYLRWFKRNTNLSDS